MWWCATTVPAAGITSMRRRLGPFDWYDTCLLRIAAEYQRFFTSFSLCQRPINKKRARPWDQFAHLLPDISAAIRVHEFPRRLCAAMSIESSSSDHGSFFSCGSRWLNQRSRHCLPVRSLGTFLPMSDHFVNPCAKICCACSVYWDVCVVNVGQY
jgi:hypothetical protein